ncbi:hypothetical protein C8R44DRAFT_860512 [Mycena epipterygia]|nr:hypothetical protein C8R44DRAFT_860512 [Mycena epipterygia]
MSVFPAARAWSPGFGFTSKPKPSSSPAFSAGKVRFGSGSGGISANAEPEPRVRFRQSLNLEPERRFSERSSLKWSMRLCKPELWLPGFRALNQAKHITTSQAGSGRGPHTACILDHNIHTPPMLLPAACHCLGPTRPTPVGRGRTTMEYAPRSRKNSGVISIYNGLSWRQTYVTEFLDPPNMHKPAADEDLDQASEVKITLRNCLNQISRYGYGSSGPGQAGYPQIVDCSPHGYEILFVACVAFTQQRCPEVIEGATNFFPTITYAWSTSPEMDALNAAKFGLP